MRGVPIHSPDVALHDVPFLVENKGLRNAADMIEGGHPMIGVEKDREADRGLLGEGGDRGLTVLLYGDGQQDKIFSLHAVVELFDRGELGTAVRAPSGPEIQHHHLAPVF